MRSNSIFLMIGFIVAAVLGLRYLKQALALSFTLLSLKLVWAGLIILIVLMSLKKVTNPPRGKD